jgi:hypothetical protein
MFMSAHTRRWHAPLFLPINTGDDDNEDDDDDDGDDDNDNALTIIY